MKTNYTFDFSQINHPVLPFEANQVEVLEPLSLLKFGYKAIKFQFYPTGFTLKNRTF